MSESVAKDQSPLGRAVGGEQRVRRSGSRRRARDLAGVVDLELVEDDRRRRVCAATLVSMTWNAETRTGNRVVGRQRPLEVVPAGLDRRAERAAAGAAGVEVGDVGELERRAATTAAGACAAARPGPRAASRRVAPGDAHVAAGQVGELQAAVLHRELLRGRRGAVRRSSASARRRDRTCRRSAVTTPIVIGSLASCRPPGPRASCRRPSAASAAGRRGLGDLEQRRGRSRARGRASSSGAV